MGIGRDTIAVGSRIIREYKTHQDLALKNSPPQPDIPSWKKIFNALQFFRGEIITT